MYEGKLTQIGQSINFVPLAMSQSLREALCAWNSLCQALLHDTLNICDAFSHQHALRGVQAPLSGPSLNSPFLSFSPAAARCRSAAMRWWPSPTPSPGSTPTSLCCHQPWSTSCARQPPSSSGCSPAHCHCSGSCPWKR